MITYSILYHITLGRKYSNKNINYFYSIKDLAINYIDAGLRIPLIKNLYVCSEKDKIITYKRIFNDKEYKKFVKYLEKYLMLK